MKLFHLKRVLLAAGVAVAAAPVHAATEIEVWHLLDGANKAQFETLVKQFNGEQDGVHVALRAFPSADKMKEAAIPALRDHQGPSLVQLADNHSPEVVADRAEIKPLYELLAKYPIKDANWFLPATTSFVRDNKGRLLAFPWMAEIPVMFYNLDAYKKAGLNPAQPARTWRDLQRDLLAIRDKAESDCPYATSQQVNIHIENLAPVNNQPLTTDGNGLGVTGKVKTPFGMEFDTLYMRHLAMMVSWVKSEMLVRHADDRSNDAAFAKGDCAVLTSGSGALGQFLETRRLNFGVAALPYYEEETSRPGHPFVSGAALWVLDRQPADKEKATAQFLAWLSKPVVAAQWHQHTGYLPLTDAAYRAADVSFYDKTPGVRQLVDDMKSQPAPTARGFRIANYDRIEAIFSQELDNALSGKTPPMVALNSAAEQARRLAAQK